PPCYIPLRPISAIFTYTTLFRSDPVGIEVMTARRAHIDEDRVVLGRPAPAWLGPIVVGPDELVQKRVSAEDLVQQQLAIVGLAVDRKSQRLNSSYLVISYSVFCL